MTFAYTTVCSQPARSAVSTMPNERGMSKQGLQGRVLIALRFASTPTRATPARAGDPGAARRPAAQGRLFASVTQHLRASVCAKAAPTLARHTGLLSFAPAGAGSSPV